LIAAGTARRALDPTAQISVFAKLKLADCASIVIAGLNS
jgi:hypothetical protein